MGTDVARDQLKFAARPSWLRRRLPEWLAARTTSSRVLLTFDDGPDPIHTPTVLDRLHEYGTAAAFFVVGNRIAQAPRLLNRIVDDGHVLGNHSFHHRRPRWFDSRSAWNEVSECQQAIATVAIRPRWFRPPLGRLTPGVVAAAWGHRLRVMTWSLDTNDWRCRSDADADRCAGELLDQIQLGDVILLHDNHRYIGRILDTILPSLADRGWLAANPLAEQASGPYSRTRPSPSHDDGAASTA